MTSLLEVHRLQVNFLTQGRPIPAIDGVDFHIDAGETLALLGESGSGKSVTALSLLRLLPRTAQVRGSILLNGRELSGLGQRQLRDIRGRHIAMIFQEPQGSLHPALRVGVQVGEGLRQRRLRGAARQEKVIELLAAVGIPEPARRMQQYPHQLSGGMQQRVMLALALAGEPELLIADEPTTALDVTTQARILALLKKIQRATGLALLFITHDLAVASQLADRVAVMRRGRILETSPARQFFRQPQHRYSRTLLKAARGQDISPSPLEGEDRGEGVNNGERDNLPLLQVTNLNLRYPMGKRPFGRPAAYLQALDNVSLRLEQGRTLAVVGESGSGKTTLGKGILQLLTPATGSVYLAGENLCELDPARLRRRRAQVQVVFQDPVSSMDPLLRVKDVVEEGMITLGAPLTAGQRQTRIEQLLAQVGLEASYQYRYPHELSGGQRQRVCIARALAVRPKLLVCDEPTSALDATVQARILELLTRLQQQLGLAYLFITHDLSLVSGFAHEVAVMRQGRIVEQGATHTVLGSPQHEYTRALLSAAPRIRGA